MRNNQEKHDNRETKPDNGDADSRRGFLKQGAAIAA
jgi:hypothetical protein